MAMKNRVGKHVAAKLPMKRIFATIQVSTVSKYVFTVVRVYWKGVRVSKWRHPTAGACGRQTSKNSQLIHGARAVLD
ncbi:MAG: hypothetical protein ABL892_10380, partial [Thiobacillaceae bacterium]